MLTSNRGRIDTANFTVSKVFRRKVAISSSIHTIHRLQSSRSWQVFQVYGYLRVSSTMQVEGDSLETQERQIHAYAATKGWSVANENIFIEAGVSGSIDFSERPASARLLSVLKSGDTIIFTKLDRAFRNVRNAFNTLHELKQMGVNAHFLDLGGEVTGNGIGAIVFAVMSAFASFERERIATRIREVKQMQKSQGKFVGGRRAFGYAIVDGVKVPRDDEQQVIAQMKTMKVSGATLRQIQCWLAASQGVELSRMGVRGVLLREKDLRPHAYSESVPTDTHMW
jgi:DNA invertase Pin-like site-specific DNA recombinase